MGLLSTSEFTSFRRRQGKIKAREHAKVVAERRLATSRERAERAQRRRQQSKRRAGRRRAVSGEFFEELFGAVWCSLWRAGR